MARQPVAVACPAGAPAGVRRRTSQLDAADLRPLARHPARKDASSRVLAGPARIADRRRRPEAGVTNDYIHYSYRYGITENTLGLRFFDEGEANPALRP